MRYCKSSFSYNRCKHSSPYEDYPMDLKRKEEFLDANSHHSLFTISLTAIRS